MIKIGNQTREKSQVLSQVLEYFAADCILSRLLNACDLRKVSLGFHDTKIQNKSDVTLIEFFSYFALKYISIENFTISFTFLF